MGFSVKHGNTSGKKCNIYPQINYLCPMKFKMYECEKHK